MDIRNFFGSKKPTAAGSARGAASSSSASAAASSRAAAVPVPTKQTKGKAAPKKRESVIDLVDSDSDKEDAAQSKKRKDDQSKSASKTLSSAKRFASIETPKSSHSRPFHRGGDDSDNGGGKQSAAAAAATTSASSRTTNRANVVTTTKKQPSRQDDLNLSSGSSDSDSDEEDELKQLESWPYIDPEFCKQLIASMSSRNSRKELIQGNDQRLCGENAGYMQCIEVMRSDGSGTLQYPQILLEDKGKYVNLHAAACAAHNGPRKKHQTASHRCQNSHCINGSHLTWESIGVNNHRKTCYGFVLVNGKRITSGCNHNPRCLNFYSMNMNSLNEEERELVMNS